MAPCPICLPSKPKWLSNGSLILCEKTSAIYCVGPTCSTTGWAASRLTIAQNVFLQAEQEKEDSESLAKAIALIDRQLAWIDSVLETVRQVDSLHTSFAKTYPLVRKSLRQSTKSGPDVQVDVGGYFQNVGRIYGAEFLTSSWREVQRLESAKKTLLSLKASVGDADSTIWSQNLASSIRTEKLKTAVSAKEILLGVRSKVGHAAAFLSDETFTTIGRWAGAGGAPPGFSVAKTATTIELRGGQSTWRARAGEITPLSPVPS